MSASLTIRPAHPYPTGHVAVLEVGALCLPGILLVFALLAHEWLPAAVAFLILIGLAGQEWRNWRRAGISVEGGQILVCSPLGYRRTIPAGDVDRMLRAGSNVFFMSRTGKRLGAFPAGTFSKQQIEALAAQLGVDLF